MICLYVHDIPAVTYSALDVPEDEQQGQSWKIWDLPGLKLVLFPAGVSPDHLVMRADPPQERYEDAQLNNVKGVVERASVDTDLRRVVDDVCDWGYLDHE